MNIVTTYICLIINVDYAVINVDYLEININLKALVAFSSVHKK